MDKKVKSVRLPKDTAEQVEQLADERDISESDMLRRLVEQGLHGDRLDDLAEQVERSMQEQNEQLDDLAESVGRIERGLEPSESATAWWRFW